MTEVSSAMYSHSLVIFPKDMSHFSIICKEYEKSKILFCGQLELDIKKKNRRDVDNYESFLGKKERANTSC